jgi:hypothetical protein
MDCFTALLREVVVLGTSCDIRHIYLVFVPISSHRHTKTLLVFVPVPHTDILRPLEFPEK